MINNSVKEINKIEEIMETILFLGLGIQLKSLVSGDHNFELNSKALKTRPKVPQNTWHYT